MTRTWTGLLVLAGLLVVGASDVTAQEPPPKEVEDLVAELRELGLNVEFVAPVERSGPRETGGFRVAADATAAKSLIAEVCACVTGLGGELAEIVLQVPGGLYISVGLSTAGFVCSLIY